MKRFSVAGDRSAFFSWLCFLRSDSRRFKEFIEIDMFTKYRVKSEYVTLAASALLCLLYNQKFWTTFISATGGWTMSGAALIGFSFIIIVILFNACLTLVSFRYMLKPVLVVLFLLTSIAAYFTDQYGATIDKSMMQNVLETDVREASELFSYSLATTVIFLGVVPAAIVIATKIDYGNWREGLARKFLIISVSCMALALFVFAFYKTLAPVFRQHRELRYLLAPTNYIQAINGVRKMKAARQGVVTPLGTDARKSSAWVQNPRKTVTLIILGETARAANFSLNGYARQTNPMLGQRSDLFNFTNVQSCGTATAVSVPCVFSSLGRENFTDEKAGSQQGLMAVLKYAQFSLLWRNNNSGCKGTCEGVEYEDLSIPEPGSSFCGTDECFDERLLAGLEKRIAAADSDLVVVLHQKGSHGPAYWRRYPAKFARFGPACQSTMFSECSTESIVSAYDNTVLYTDYVIDQAIRLLSEHREIDSSLIYFADHGESLGEKNLFLHGAPYVISPIEQRHVPLMVWMSDGFQKRINLDAACLTARRDTALSHDNIFHSILGMLQIQTKVYNPTLDLFAGCTHAR
ncbi:phosphoethanolamine transferase [Massilia sp. CF038]|uniref:phosphoethanolamine transferase n=1 Tax=Massilia sp. CF038 TaxID=1881045 RepID=UPI00091A5B69|nr:phosphoethanolamine--lipid A transferase [Massilia sp. CF038]SHG76148.1 phosphatidylethanolamine:Kdo2-lipid A phosphoethanolamine transferase [Massilia sp. CF038]